MGELIGLKSKKCVPCEAGAQPLSETEVNRLCQQVGDGTERVLHSYEGEGEPHLQNEMLQPAVWGGGCRCGLGAGVWMRGMQCLLCCPSRACWC
jgi:hypothetical protein